MLRPEHHLRPLGMRAPEQSASFPPQLQHSRSKSANAGDTVLLQHQPQSQLCLAGEHQGQGNLPCQTEQKNPDEELGLRQHW